MNLEKARVLSTSIENVNTNERREVLFERIEQISLIYAEKKFQEIRKADSNYKFSQAIKDYTATENIILRPIIRLEEFEFEVFQDKIDLFLEDFYKEVDTACETSDLDLDIIYNLINSKKDSIKGYLEVESYKELARNSKEEGTKVLNFNNIVNIEMDANKKYQDLENIGFHKMDRFVEIHVEDFYQTDEANLGPELIKHDLSVVAEYIIDKEPETVAVLGKSWLLDTPLANRLGFTKIEEDEAKQNDFSVWLQFINKNGQIDQKRFNKLLESGELPYKSVRAYMLTEDFLRKYLPESRRGKIVVKELNPDRRDFWQKIQEDAQSMKLEWHKLIESHADFDTFIKHDETLNNLLSFLTPENKTLYLGFLKRMYDNSIPWSEFHEHKDASIQEIDAEINQAMKKDLYKDKEVNI